MKKAIITVVLMAELMGSSVWALFETNKELSQSATVTLEKAVQAAVVAVPVEVDVHVIRYRSCFFYTLRGKLQQRRVGVLEILDGHGWNLRSKNA